MGNLIKMNLYRMTHAVSTWVLACVSVAIALMDLLANKMLHDGLFGIDFGTEAATPLLTGIETLCNFFQSSNILIVAAIFVVIFSHAENKCGFDKNIVGITNQRWKQTLARWISAVIGMTGIVAVGYGTFLGLSAVLMNDFELGNLGAFLKTLGLLYFGMVVFSAVFFFFTTLFNSSTGGIVASLVVSLGLLSLVEQILDVLATKAFGDLKHVPSDFFFDSAYIYLDVNMGDIATRSMIFFIALGLVYLVLSLGGSMMIQQKRDIH